MRIPRFIAAAAWLAVAACQPAGSGGILGSAPVRAPIRLLDLEARVAGAADRSPPESLLERNAAALAEWEKTSAAGAVRFASPVLAANGVGGAGRLRLRLRPGGARGVSIVPYPGGDQLAREHRALRRLEIALQPGADPDTPVDLQVDLHEPLHGSFGDAGRPGRLSRLEVLLPGADSSRAALLSLRIDPRRLLPTGRAAAPIVADHHSVLRPAWAVAGGATVELPLALPDTPGELRWFDASTPGCGSRTVEVELGSEISTLAVSAGSGQTWTPMRRSLERWAGREVVVRLRVEGAGVGLFGTPVVVSAPETTDAATPDVLVYLIDTLRADHLGVGGSTVPGVSPTLDRLAREGVWFRRAQSSSPWTKPAIATLMTGIQPPTHRVGATSYTDRLPAGVPLLQERFRDAGWRTGSFTANPLGSTLSALERGFDAAVPPRFWGDRARLERNPAADQLSESLLAWIEEEPDRPFFAYLHTLEVHEWKLPRYQRDLAAGASGYDAAIRDADSHLGDLLDALALRARPLWVVVVSDHGESWGDHGMPSHGFGLYQSQTHIPLIFWSSRAVPEPGLVVDAPVALADLAPTLLDGFGLPGLESTDGTSLVRALRGEAPPARPILSSLLRFVWAPNAARQHAITTPEQIHLIRPEGGVARAFDLVVDPQEQRPTAPDPALEHVLDDVLAEQGERAAAFERRYGPVVPGPITLDGAERLRALGYLEDSASRE